MAKGETGKSGKALAEAEKIDQAKMLKIEFL